MDRPSSRRQSARPDGRARRADLNCQLRLFFVAGAEERTRLTLARGLTNKELQGIIEHYPGDTVD